jgi:hypothetical protein
MPAFYNEIGQQFMCGLRDDVINAIEAACITEAEWRTDPDGCIGRVYGALEELTDFEF